MQPTNEVFVVYHNDEYAGDTIEVFAGLDAALKRARELEPIYRYDEKYPGMIFGSTSDGGWCRKLAVYTRKVQ